jgi:hypothetical protein
MRRLALVASLACACVTVLIGSGVAAADVFSPIELISSRPVQIGSSTISEQAESAKESVISADGLYVAFVGSFGGVQGIWRRDLETGAVEQVAPAGAELPSISKEGRYVSFTTATSLVPEDDHNSKSDVYMRDMDKPCQSEGGACLACAEGEAESCPFVLVSAVNGSSEGATYVYPEGISQSYGSLASGRSAMSANGEYVVFQTEAESNLLASPTPPREILLRDLRTDETTLVSSEYDPQTGTDNGVPVPLQGKDGAAFPVRSSEQGTFGGASINAEGNTVAWLGQEIGRQARLLPEEQATYKAEIDEPLWRRVSEGGSAPTRRVTGFSEPESPACVASGQTTLVGASLQNPCQGPFKYVGLPEDLLLAALEGMDFVPQLSANGNKVAFLASAPEVASEQELEDAEADDDLYISEMGGGLTRVQALRRLTEIAGEPARAELGAKILEASISPDGNEVAFTTRRTEFRLESLSFVSPIEPKAGISELYDADLANETLTRVTHGYASEATPSERAGSVEETGAGASSPSFSENGNTLSFSSSAYNLIYGDGNGAPDAFIASRISFPDVTPLQYVSTPPAPPVLSPTWRLFATAASQANGDVVLNVEVPGAGELSASASGKVPVTISAASSAGRAKHAAKARTALMTRTVASDNAGVPADTDGMERLTLSLKHAYSALARRSGGLYTKIALKFSAPGHPSLSTSVYVTFHRTIAKPHSSRTGRSTHKRTEHRA